MRILLINEYFPPVAPGGAEWSVYYLAEALVRRGHAVGVVTVNHGPEPRVPPGVECFAMPFPFRLPAGQKMYRQGFLENPIFHAVFSGYLSGICRGFKPDVIHSQSKNALVAGTWVSKWSGIPHIITLRDIGITCPYGMCFINGRDVNQCSLGTCLDSCSAYLVEHYSPKRTWDRIKIRLLALALWPDTRLKQWCLSQAFERIVPSRGLLASFPQKIQKGSPSWMIIPHLPPSVASGGDTSGGSSEPTAPAPAVGTEPFVLYLGKISPGKGIYVLEQAIRKVAAQRPETKFVFAGKGRWTPPSDLPIQSIGSVEHSTALALMRQSTCVVVPSIVPEAFNRVVLEAMSLGKPVIASDAGSLPEQVKDQETGFVVPKGSSEALAQAIMRLTSDRQLADRFGDQARQWAGQMFSADETLECLEEVYQRADKASTSPRWKPLNFLSRLFLQGIVLFNDKAKRLSMWLVFLTRKSTQRIHPKNLVENEDATAWYKPLLRKEDRVLDIGAGHGSHTLVAATGCREAVGVEYDSANLRTCQKRAEERGLANVRFVSGNAEKKLPFEDGSFDTVLLLDVLEHLHERAPALAEIHRVLGKGGRLLVAIPNRLTTWKRRLKRAGLFYYSDRDHKIEYSLSEARHELESNGFAIEEPIQPVVYDTPWVGVIDLIGGISLRLYKRLMVWKTQYAQQHPDESIGFQIVAYKN